MFDKIYDSAKLILDAVNEVTLKPFGDDLTKLVLCSLASQYGIKTRADREDYSDLYPLFLKARAYEKDNKDAIHSLVHARVQAIKYVSDTVVPSRADLDEEILPLRIPSPYEPGKTIPDPGPDGLCHIRRRDVARNYVVFSDHHLIDKSNRQNFFGNCNKGFYLDVLSNYYAAKGFDLVENGDVEELIIHEPRDIENLEDAKNWDWPEIFERRDEMIKRQIYLIAKDNADYYRTIFNSFAKHGRYHKVVGNHDVALLKRRWMNQLRDETGYDFEDPCETLLLSDDERHHYFIAHGHQFDHSCTKGHEKKLGETISQSSAWAFQGPDRTWRFELDWIDDMLVGKRRVFNTVVGVESEKIGDLSADQWTALAALFAFGGALAPGSAYYYLGNGLLSSAGLGLIFGVVPAKDFIEIVMNKNVAWEYFENPNDGSKLISEFLCGTRWFKFRHMDELYLTDFMENEAVKLDGIELRPPPWGDRPVPTLVLGHTHEPRLRAMRPGKKNKRARHYINSGAAGRFENLLWGVEILAGKAMLISWHRNEKSVPVRTIWEPEYTPTQGWLLPVDSATISELTATRTGESLIGRTNQDVAVFHNL